jgi:3-methyladenine DNA glycosylase AlkD
MTPTPPTLEEMIAQLRSMGTAANVAGQQHFAIVGGEQLGVSVYDLRKLAKGLRDHDLALALWQTNIHEARILAALVDDPAFVTREQMDTWVSQFESWDICDEVTDELFIHAADILEVLPGWASHEEEFIRRAAFASIAAMTVHRKDLPDDVIRGYFPLIEAASDDDRNFVWKAVNWALRNIAKFRPSLKAEAISCARRILARDTKAARKIAKDALKEFETKFGVDYVASIE